jgi:hypothetical protein
MAMKTSGKAIRTFHLTHSVSPRIPITTGCQINYGGSSDWWQRRGKCALTASKLYASLVWIPRYIFSDSKSSYIITMCNLEIFVCIISLFWFSSSKMLFTLPIPYSVMCLWSCLTLCLARASTCRLWAPSNLSLH